MPRTKKQTSGQPSDPLPEANGQPGEVFTLAEAAAYLRADEADVIGLIHSQALPGRLIAGEWRFLKAAIQQWLSASGPTPETRKAAQVAAGSFKDDPDLVPMTEEIYR